MAGQPRLAVRDLTVSYASHQVVNGLSFDVGAGAAVALLGANGSGKSTTVKALTGVVRAGGGSRISLNGATVRPRDLTPGDTRRLGIRVVHQEAPLIAGLTVAEMMALHTGFPSVAGVVKKRALMRTCEETLAQFDVPVRPASLCGDLTSGDRALVSLAISMAGIPVESALLVLDEATASLASKDAERLLRRVRDATERGLGVLMVTHRLAEVSEFCDSTIVLRGGDIVRTFSRDDFSEDEAVEEMVGQRAVRDEPDPGRGPARRHAVGVTLEVSDLAGKELRSATFSCAAGEILGVAGRGGEGASDLLRLIGGVSTPLSGRVVVAGEVVSPRSTRSAVMRGVHYVSSDRLDEGGVPLMTVAENMLLPRVERYGIRRRGADEDVERSMRQLSVHPDDPRAPFGSLSGGNQQKVLLLRWLLLGPRVMLLDDPTAGVDPAAREIIFGQLRTLAEHGTSIMLRSSEPEHLARLCDRVLVIQDGRIVNELSGQHLTLEEVTHATFV